MAYAGTYGSATLGRCNSTFKGVRKVQHEVSCIPVVAPFAFARWGYRRDEGQTGRCLGPNTLVVVGGQTPWAVGPVVGPRYDT